MTADQYEYLLPYVRGYAASLRRPNPLAQQDDLEGVGWLAVAEAFHRWGQDDPTILAKASASAKWAILDYLRKLFGRSHHNGKKTVHREYATVWSDTPPDTAEEYDTRLVPYVEIDESDPMLWELIESTISAAFANIVMWHYQDGYSTSDIAELFHYNSTACVSSMLSQAKSQLKEMNL